MLRIHCTADDLLRCRFVARPAPLVELVLALMMLRRRDRSLFDSWRRRTWLAFPRAAGRG